MIQEWEDANDYTSQKILILTFLAKALQLETSEFIFYLSDLQYESFFRHEIFHHCDKKFRYLVKVTKNEKSAVLVVYFFFQLLKTSFN